MGRDAVDRRHCFQGSAWVPAGADQRVPHGTEANHPVRSLTKNQLSKPALVAKQISKVLEAFEVLPGVTICLGTPDHVGPAVRIDLIETPIDGPPNLSVKIV
jgi:hypothetical protein